MDATVLQGNIITTDPLSATPPPPQPPNHWNELPLVVVIDVADLRGHKNEGSGGAVDIEGERCERHSGILHLGEQNSVSTTPHPQTTLCVQYYCLNINIAGIGIREGPNAPGSCTYVMRNEVYQM